MTASRKVYKNDPIQEAICELRFDAPSAPWAVMPGLLFQRLSQEYPAEPVQDGIGSVVQPPPGAPAGIQFMVGQGIPGRVRLSSASGNELLLIGGSVITISCLPPYSGWSHFKHRIRQVLDEFVGIAGTEFKVTRIGVRYINRVVCDLSQLDEYFGLKPLTYGPLGLDLSSFICRSELPTQSDFNKLVIATFAGQEQEGEKAVLLDIDAIAQDMKDLDDVDQAMDLIESLRRLERDAFEASITETARLGPFGGYEVKDDE